MKRKSLLACILVICLLAAFSIFRFTSHIVPAGTVVVSPALAATEISANMSKEPLDIEMLCQTSDAFRTVRDMRVGWNLGNSFDSMGTSGTGWNHRKLGVTTNFVPSLSAVTPEQFYEQYWQNPVTTRKMIDAVADAGFGAVRVPISWYDHISEFDADGDGQDDLDAFYVREEWLERIGEIADYVLENDMYCIINIHHDGNWLQACTDDAKRDVCEKRFAVLWQAIANHFEDYDERLVFEGFNEVLTTTNNADDWIGSAEGYTAIDRLNQIFVDTVRETGGNNRDRFLIVKTYAAGTSADILSAFNLPTDRVEDRLIISVHLYEPSRFTMSKEVQPWLANETSQFDKEAETEIDQYLTRISDTLVRQGVPVIIGEFGAWNKTNEADRAAYAAYIVGQARKSGMTCFWWDTGLLFTSPAEVKGSALLDRSTNTIFFPSIVSAMVEAA